jgi:hypothetical protein
MKADRKKLQEGMAEARAFLNHPDPLVRSHAKAALDHGDVALNLLDRMPSSDAARLKDAATGQR